MHNWIQQKIKLAILEVFKVTDGNVNLFLMTAEITTQDLFCIFFCFSCLK